MKSWTAVLMSLTVLLAMAMSGFAQQSKGSVRTVAKSALPNSTPSVAAVKATSRKTKGINADLAYKSNCSRCHAAPHKFSDRVMATVMRHMRVRANLTQEETKAILQYLTE